MSKVGKIFLRKLLEEVKWRWSIDGVSTATAIVMGFVIMFLIYPLVPLAEQGPLFILLGIVGGGVSGFLTFLTLSILNLYVIPFVSCVWNLWTEAKEEANV